jgi:Domain of unknown function (DUF4037)
VSAPNGGPFIQGLKLSELLYEEAVKPILAAHWPQLAYSAALLGPGSEVLGFDTLQSKDHDWGPRLLLFLGREDLETHQEAIDQALRQELPAQIHGYPTDLASRMTEGAAPASARRGGVAHSVRLTSTHAFFYHWLRWDPDRELRAVDWVTFPEQNLRSVTAGRVFHDELALEPVRTKLRYYPRDVWLYLLATQWRRISQEEPFMGRCGQVGDEVGSRLVAARLVRDLMRLCFLMERQYAPYIKWLGTAFGHLHCAGPLVPLFLRALGADSWPEREQALTPAYEFVARMHNDLGITEPLSAKVQPFHDRPFQVLNSERFADAIQATISDPIVRALPPNLGAIDQFVDSTDVLSYPERFNRLKLMYEG